MADPKKAEFGEVAGPDISTFAWNFLHGWTKKEKDNCERGRVWWGGGPRYVYLCKIFSTWLNQNRKVKLRGVWWGRVWAQTVWGRSANCCWWRIQVNLCHVELLSSCLEDKLERLLIPVPWKDPISNHLLSFPLRSSHQKKAIQYYGTITYRTILLPS